jgi:micrococcal nuclease
LGEQSRAYLELLLAANDRGEVEVVPIEQDRYGRTVAEVFVMPDKSNQAGEEIHINSEMLMAGMAYVYPQYVDGYPNGATLKRAEVMGQEAKVGVWSGEYERPWEYRKSQ